jgi:hypothetical protein
MLAGTDVQGPRLWALINASKTLYAFDRCYRILIFNVYEARAILCTQTAVYAFIFVPLYAKGSKPPKYSKKRAIRTKIPAPEIFEDYR